MPSLGGLGNGLGNGMGSGLGSGLGGGLGLGGSLGSFGTSGLPGVNAQNFGARQGAVLAWSFGSLQVYRRFRALRASRRWAVPLGQSRKEHGHVCLEASLDTGVLPGGVCQAGEAPA